MSTTGVIGPAGAGKTTISAALAPSKQRSVHLPTDHWIVAGYAPRWKPSSPHGRWKDQFVPQSGEGVHVDGLLDVGRRTIAKDLFVDASKIVGIFEVVLDCGSLHRMWVGS